MQRLRHAAWWVADYAYALKWQIMATFSREHARSFEHGHHAPVIILPGVYETWKFMLPLVRELHRRGHPVHVIDALQRNRAQVAEGAGLASGVIIERDLAGAIIVAHSKGGLIGKHIMTEGVARDRVDAMVAIATPFSGSSYARFLPGRALRSFMPSDVTLRFLAREVAANNRITSVFPEFDPHIPESSVLEGAANVRIGTGGHFRVLAHPRTIAEVVKVTSGHSAHGSDS